MAPSGDPGQPGALGLALFDFAVPDELLTEAVAHHKDPEAVADLRHMPGIGEGKPPPLLDVLRRHGALPLVLLTVAAFIPGSFGNGIVLLGRNLQESFHIHDAALGTVAFVAQVAQLLWAVPLALWADRRSRRTVSAVALIVFALVAPFMGLAPNVWAFTFLYLVASVGFGVNNTAHNSYLTDAYPTEARGRVFSWHNLADPLAGTLGFLVVGEIAQATGNWRWGMVIAAAGLPAGLALFFLPEPEKGANEASHILKASGMDLHAQQTRAPRVMLGSAMTRLLRVRSLYFELVAVAILGFAGTGAPLFGNLFFSYKFGLAVGPRADVYSAIGLAGFLGLPLAYVIGDRYFRRAPEKPLVIAGACITAYGVLFVSSLYVPSLPACVALQFLANAAVSPLSICIFLTLAATAPAEMRTICFAMFGVYSLVFGGFTGSVLMGAVADAVAGTAPSNAAELHGIVTALSFIAPVCALGGALLLAGSRHVRHDITLVIEDVLERFAEGKRRAAGAAVPALQIHNLDFFYATTQVLFDVDLQVAQGEMLALLGTNGAGKSTLLRTVAGLEHPHRGVVRIDGIGTTWLEPEQITALGVAVVVGGRMTFPTMSVRDNLRVAAHPMRRDRQLARQRIDEALAVFPELADHLDQPAGTLSGGEQQMLALARATLVDPKLLLVDELALGLAPKTVDRLLALVRRLNEGGTTVVVVEQSVNRAMGLCERAVFLERGRVRFDGPVSELAGRDDLLRPVFLAAAAEGLGQPSAGGERAPELPEGPVGSSGGGGRD